MDCYLWMALYSYFHPCAWQCWAGCKTGTRALTAPGPGLASLCGGQDWAAKSRRWWMDAPSACTNGGTRWTLMPDRPWQKLGTDLLTYKSHQYLAFVDNYSRFVETAPLPTLDSPKTITIMKSMFARHRVPDTLVLDNGPQYDSAEFTAFAKDYGFKHIASSQHYPHANECAEHAVETLMSMLRKADNPYKALLAYRSTPIENGYSPAELLYWRKIRTTVCPVPTMPQNLLSRLPDMPTLREREAEYRDRMKSRLRPPPLGCSLTRSVPRPTRLG